MGKSIKGEEMKNYFNQHDASNHLILMVSQAVTNNLIDANCVTEEERKILKKISKLVNDFNDSVFERLGDGYRRSLRNKADLNTIRVVSRNVHHQNNIDMEDFIDSETLRDLVSQGTDLDCSGCEKTDCKRCAIYKIKSYLQYEGISDETDLCPYRKELEFKEFNFEL